MSGQRAAVEALQRLRRAGFGGHRLLDDQGDLSALCYRRVWRSVADVVLVYDVDDARAYRADDHVVDGDPFEAGDVDHLLIAARGRVVDVVDDVLRWTPARTWPSHYPSASAPGNPGSGAEQPR